MLRDRAQVPVTVGTGTIEALKSKLDWRYYSKLDSHKRHDNRVVQ